MPMQWKFALRIWGTLHEPRAVTAVMMLSYTGVLTAVTAVLTDARPDPAATTVGALIAGVGALAGIPSAWRGSWWGEAVAALAVVAGLAAMIIMEVAISAETEHWRGFTLGLTVSLAALFTQRCLRIWPYRYRPDRAPTDAAVEAKALTRAYKMIGDDLASAQ